MLYVTFKVIQVTPHHGSAFMYFLRGTSIIGNGVKKTMTDHPFIYAMAFATPG